MRVFSVTFPMVPEAGTLLVDDLANILYPVRTLMGDDNDEGVLQAWEPDYNPFEIKITVVEMSEEKFNTLKEWEF